MGSDFNRGNNLHCSSDRRNRLQEKVGTDVTV